MSDSLQHLLEPGRREAVVADLAAVIDSEVADKKGLSGTAIKGGYNTANKFKPGLVPHATDKLLPEFVSALTPFWDSRPGPRSVTTWPPTPMPPPRRCWPSPTTTPHPRRHRWPRRTTCCAARRRRTSPTHSPVSATPSRRTPDLPAAADRGARS
jgi:hypothetical protein